MDIQPIEPVRVLFIDDDQEDIQFFTDALTVYNKDYQLCWLQDSSTISGFLRSMLHLPDIIFLDVKMPLLSGIDCLKLIKKFSFLSKVPVVMFSTYIFPEDISRARKYHAGLYIKKPFAFCSYMKIFTEIFSARWQTRLLSPALSAYVLDVESVSPAPHNGHPSFLIR